jgi:hypothetical protein
MNLTFLSFCIPCCAFLEAVKSGLPLDMHSSLNYTNILLMRPQKQYSPKALNQAVEDFQTGKFNSIRACARHHGVPMTTLHYRVKLKLKHSEVRYHVFILFGFDIFVKFCYGMCFWQAVSPYRTLGDCL